VSKKAREREQQRRNREQRGLPTTEPKDDQPKLWERRMEERGLRLGWNLPAEIKATVVSRLVDVVERDETLDAEGIAVISDRYLVSAARTLVYADLGQQRIDLAKERHAERMAAAARAATPNGAPPPGDEEPPKRIIIPDVDDRLESRED
jgi:hypothetical protein